MILIIHNSYYYWVGGPPNVCLCALAEVKQGAACSLRHRRHPGSRWAFGHHLLGHLHRSSVVDFRPGSGEESQKPQVVFLGLPQQSLIYPKT